MQQEKQTLALPCGAGGPATLSKGLLAGLAMQLAPGSRVGLDIVQVSRVQESLASFGSHFTTRFFTEGELAYSLAAEGQEAERLAARFAAKEAAIKALSFAEAGVDWREMEVRRDADGACSLVLHGRALQLAREAGVSQLLVSLSHDGDYAGAVVLAALSDKTG